MAEIIYPEYCAAIRTLGKAKDKYLTLLTSLQSQTHPPKQIIVYLANGYPKPTESIGIEQIVYVPKGMVAQRALQYHEVNTEWMLLLDDDIAIEPDGVEKMFKAVFEKNGDVIAFDGFPHNKLSLKSRITMALILSSFPRLYKSNKGYTINCIGADVYNPNPKSEICFSTTNSGNGILCRKKDFLNIHLEDDLWLDDAPYAIPEDKVMFYKMHLTGLKILTHYNSGFVHLDAGSAITNDRAIKMIYSNNRNNRIFFKLYIWPNIPTWKKPLAWCLWIYQRIATSIYYSIKSFNAPDVSKARRQGIKSADIFIKNKR